MSHPKTKIDLKNNEVVFWLDSKIYSLESIYNTAYVFLDRAYVFLDGDPEKEIEVHLKGKEELDGKKLEALQGEFLNELLNFLLRTKIAKRNKKIREYIIASALVSGLPNSFVSPNEDKETKAGWQDDPLGIAVPWEEKNQKPTGKKR
ncbi:MAG: His-Xaa-Ser system protein HxsD [Patescibacteria group bacterium]|nr:His-Xaa-Ser system protein HxsD [Patescibacteria group bacterium]